MLIFTLILSCLLILVSILPFVRHQHWIFRAAEFFRLQLIPIQLAAFVLGFVYFDFSWYYILIQCLQAALIFFNGYILVRYTKFWKTPVSNTSEQHSREIRIIASNVYQFNTEYHRLTELVQREQPDIFMTMESNSDWEKALRVLEKDYPNTEKVTLENTYGMHLYTRLKINNIQTHYFVADDLPSIEAELETEDGYRFVFFGVHPPPPSPTEENNSRERDGDLLSVAKRIRQLTLPVVVSGDFNNVAWAKSSRLFRKTSELIDARIGRGIISTFHAKYWFFRVPLDLLFHSPDIFIDRLFTYPSIGSDHFPIGCSFHIAPHDTTQKEQMKTLEPGEMKEVDDMIEDGKNEESDNRKPAD